MHTHPLLRPKALLYRGLANERRLFILSLLLRCPRTGKELSYRLGICAPCISKHMRILMTARLVFGQRVKGAVEFHVSDVEATRRYLRN